MILSCGENTMALENDIVFKMNRISEQTMGLLIQRIIFFGHQSVGQNIIDGLVSLGKDFPKANLKIMDYTGNIDRGAFLHAPIGKNMDPESKIDGFVEYMEKGIGNKADIAFFKFCYVDITSQTDVDKLFEKYQIAMDHLAGTYPKTLFLHATVPLTVVQTGPRAWVKKVIGRPIGGYADNIQRNRFNDLIRQNYREKAPIFDLALIEATLPDRKTNSFSQDGKSYHFLVPEYASDGRHLNKSGGRLAAAEMLRVLVASFFGKMTS
jgi:hypothetical protein